MEDKTIACRVFVGKPEIKAPLGKPWRRWENIIQIHLQNKAWGGLD
jgi:hypothetical protein